ncbi:hypothetical protein DFH28DRAFT_1135992 [Melampsora americana]|nr:hypothetical protein DFH28DRAFT_1135992 [Melampsora americana]
MANQRIPSIPLTSRPDRGFRPLSRIDNINRSGSGDFTLHTFQAVQPWVSGQERSNNPAKGPMMNPQVQYKYDPRFDYKTPLSPTPTQASSWRIQSHSDLSYNQSIAGSGSKATSVGKGVIPVCSTGNVADVGLGLTNPALFHHGPHMNNNFNTSTAQSNLIKRQDEDSANDENQSSKEINKVVTDEDENDNKPSNTFNNHADIHFANAVLDDVTGPLQTNLAETHCRFQIKFNVWRKIVVSNTKGKSKQNSKKRGQGLSSFAWPIFRQKLLDSENHKKNNEAVLNDSITYKLFMDVARQSPVNAKMGFKIIHPNPKEHSGTSSEEEDDDRSVLDKEDETQNESEDKDPINAKLQILMAKFSKSFKAGENVAVFPNPKKAGKIMVLTTRRLRQWASNWADGKRGVNKVNPPSTQGCRFVPVADYKKEQLRMIQMDDGTDNVSVTHPNTTPGGTNVSTSPGISINLFGGGPIPFGNHNFLSPMAPRNNTSITPQHPTGPFSMGPGALTNSNQANTSVSNEIRSLLPAA